MAKKNLISIIIPVYNGERFIAEAIESCLRQSEQRGWEVIVVNDGSTDNSVNIIDRYLNDPRVKLVSHENKGLPAARNTGIANSSGNYLAFLDADDCYLPHTIKNFLAACRQFQVNKSLGMFYSNFLRMNERGETTGAVRVSPPMKRPGLHLQFLLPKRYPITVPSTLVRRDVLEKVGVFDERFQHCEDMQLFVRIAEKYDLAKLDFFSFRRRVHENQMTKNRSSGVFWREEYSIEYLKRHDFCYFCKTHDRDKQAKIAEQYGDFMLKGPEPWGPWPRIAIYLYERSLSMLFDERVQAKLEKLRNETSNSAAIVLDSVHSEQKFP